MPALLECSSRFAAIVANLTGERPTLARLLPDNSSMQTVPSTFDLTIGGAG
jgi:hypothetical protein